MTNELQKLITSCLNDAHTILLKQVPLTKAVAKTVDVGSVRPVDLGAFIENNNIPQNCSFDSTSNSYDAFDGDVLLYWEVETPNTQKDREEFKARRFPQILHEVVHRELKLWGYTRESVSSAVLYRDQPRKVFYEKYLNKEYKFFIALYFQMFKKKC